MRAAGLSITVSEVVVKLNRLTMSIKRGVLTMGDY